MIRAILSGLGKLFTSEDGGLSFSKLLTIWVAAMYSFNRPLPVIVACLLVVSAHGTKVLLAWVGTRPIATTETISSKTTSTPPTVETAATKTVVTESAASKATPIAPPITAPEGEKGDGDLPRGPVK